MIHITYSKAVNDIYILKDFKNASPTILEQDRLGLYS